MPRFLLIVLTISFTFLSLNTNTIKQGKYIKLLSIIISAFCGGVFIFSAYTKLFPIELFELQFVDIGLANWTLAPVEARIFIGIEFLLGALLFLNLTFSRRTYILALLLLVVFTVYLIVQIVTHGNTGNCGCFGSELKMTPLQGIFKNIGLIALVGFLYFFKKESSFKNETKIIPIICIIALTVPFILNPVDFDIASHFSPGDSGYKLNLDLLYNSKTNPKPDTELRKGKWVIAYLSLTCPHCKLAAYKLHIMKKKNPALPIYFILNGKDENIKPFFEETKSENVPHSFFKGRDYLKMSGPELPAIFMVNNSIVDRKPNYFVVNQHDIENWFAGKK